MFYLNTAPLAPLVTCLSFFLRVLSLISLLFVTCQTYAQTEKNNTKSLAIANTEYECQDYLEFATFNEYQQCLHRTLEHRDNGLSQQWGLNDKVVREKETIYITVANRKHALAFKDEVYPFDEEHGVTYGLQHYDAEQQKLYLYRIWYESVSTVIVDMTTGYWQEFAGVQLEFSPNGQFVAGFYGRLGLPSYAIVVWQRQESQDEQYIHDYGSNILYEYVAELPSLPAVY